MSKVREDLVVPYRHIPAKPRGDASSILSQSLPMAAMFMKNKMLSWAAVFLAVQAYLNEPAHKPVSADDATQQPPILKLLFALFSVGTCYLDIVFPGTNPAVRKAAQLAAASDAAKA